MKDLTIYPTAVELTVEIRIVLEDDGRATMTKNVAAEKKRQENSEKLKGRYIKEIEHNIKKKEMYRLAVQSLPQKDDTDVWKKVNMATLRTLVNWERRKEDIKLPTTRMELQRRWNEK